MKPDYQKPEGWTGTATIVENKHRATLLVWGEEPTVAPPYPNGTIMTAQFKVKENAKAGDFAFKSDESGCENLISDGMGKPILCRTNNLAQNLKVAIPATGITLNKDNLNLEKGQTSQLTATLSPEGATGTVSWISSDNTVASVNADGVVTAVNAGTATITATANGKSDSCTVEVTNPLKSISIEGKETLKKGQTTQMTVKYNPEDTTDDKTVTWSSSDKNVADVNQNGIVKAISDGTAIITATVGVLKADLAITVKEVPLQSIELNKEETTIHRGESEKLTVSYNPEDTTDDKKVDWSSSDPERVTVDGDGNVKAVALSKTGTAAIITAKVGSHTATCKVSVDAPLQEIQPIESQIQINKGQTKKITYTLVPEDTTDDKTVTITSSDPSVVSVNGDEIVAIKEGVAELTLKGVNEVQAKVTVNVAEVPIGSVTLDKDNVTLEKGENTTLTATINPTETTDDDRTITWESSNLSVVSVSPNKTESGEAVTITAQKGGTAVITAISSNGKRAECTVKVPVRTESIEIEEVQSILRGQTKIPNVKFDPENTDDDKTLIWESSDSSVASVDKNSGMITALKEGVVEITATTTETKTPISDTIEVAVKENHLDKNLAKQIQFEELKGDVLKGQTVNMNDFLTLSDLIEKEQITDDIEIEWQVNDETVATIDQTGCLTGLKEGDTIVIASICCTGGNGDEIGIYKVNTEIHVKEIPLDSIAFDKVIKEMKVGQIAKLNVIFNPEDTTDVKNVVWSTSDEQILTVDNGTLTAKKAGVATITAKVGDKSVDCEITVKANQTQENTNSSSSNKEEGAVQTGDTSHVGVYGVLLILAGAISLFILLSRKKRHFF